MVKNIKKNFVLLVIWVITVICATFLGRFGGDIYDHFFSRSIVLTVTQKWEVFTVLHAGGSQNMENGDLSMLGALPQYRHSTTIINPNNKRKVTDIKIQISNVTKKHKIIVEPRIFNSEIGDLEPISFRWDAQKNSNLPNEYGREIRIPMLPATASVQIIVSKSLEEPSVSLTKVSKVISPDTIPVTPLLNESAETKRLNGIVEMLFPFPDFDIERWQKSDIKATIEFHPDSP